MVANWVTFTPDSKTAYISNAGLEHAPGWIALRGELPSARVKHISAAFGAKGMKQQPACIGIPRVDEYRDHLEVTARLFLGPGARARRKSLQVECVVALDMTDVATGMVRPFGQKDRLDAALEKFVVEFRYHLRRGGWVANGQRGQDCHGYESTTRHSNSPPRRRRPSLEGTSNANFDKPDLAPRRCETPLQRHARDPADRSLLGSASWTAAVASPAPLISAGACSSNAFAIALF